MVVPVGDDGWVYVAGHAVEHGHGSAAVGARREDPIEGGDLAAVGAEDCLDLAELLERRDDFSIHAHDRVGSSVRAVIGVGVGSVEIRAGEVVEVAGVGRG